jgi:hypothetical protein
MGSAMEVARFRSRLMSSEGLKPTEQQLEALTIAATRLAAMQKTEWSEAAEKLSATWQGMGTKGIKPLNIAVDQSVSLMEKQKQILEGLAKQTNVTLSQAAKEKALIKEKDDAYLHLSSTMNDNGTIAAIMNYNQVTRLEMEIKWVQDLERAYKMLQIRQATTPTKATYDTTAGGHSILPASAAGGKMWNLLSEAMGYGGQEGLLSFSGKEPPQRGQFTGDDAMKFFEGKAKKRGGGARKKDASGFDADLERLAKELEEELQYIIEQATKRAAKRLAEDRKGREAGMEASGESQKLIAEAEFKKFAEETGRSAAVGKLQGTTGGGIYGDGAANAALRSAEAFAKYKEVVASTNTELQSLATGGIQNVYGGLVNIADAAISGADNIGLMALGWFKSITLGLSNQLLAMGIAATIEGTGLAASLITAPLAAGSFAKAGIFYAGAGTMLALGLGASAISAAVTGGGGSAGGPPAYAGRSGGSPGSTPSFGRAVEDKRPLNINVYIGDPMRPDQQLLMTKQIQVQLQKAA